MNNKINELIIDNYFNFVKENFIYVRAKFKRKRRRD